MEKEIFLDDLPRWEKRGKGNQGSIDWNQSIKHKVKGVYGGMEFEVEIVDYDIKTKSLYIKYKDEDIFEIKTNHFSRCKLGKLLDKFTKDFKVKIGTTFKDNKRDIIIIDKKYELCESNNQNKKYYKYKCNKCGYNDGWIEECHLLKSGGCSCCHGKTAALGINTIWDIAKWMIDLGVSEEDAKKYTKNSNQKIIVKCPDCGRIKDKPMMINDICNNKTIRCSCGDGMSYPNKFMFNILEQLRINFDTEYSPNWIKPRRYDFYFKINDEECIIEVHGKQHYEETSRKGARALAEEIENDRIKKKLALINGIKEENYIVINCKKSELEWIRDDVLISRLNDLFDLSNIKWLKCEEFALKNRVKEVCELKKNNPDIKIVEIASFMKIGKDTIRKYLKKGAKLGWCEYDTEKEFKKSSIKEKVQVEIFKDGVSQGIFESISELIRQSEKIFDVKLSRGNISQVCMGKRNHHKGFTFKYVQK